MQSRSLPGQAAAAKGVFAFAHEVFGFASRFAGLVSQQRFASDRFGRLGVLLQVLLLALRRCCH